MANAPITDMFDEIMSVTPGATSAIVKQTLLATLREFFVQSGAWIKEAPPVSLKEGVSDYHLDPQAGGDVLYVHAIAFPVGPRHKFIPAVSQRRARAMSNSPTAMPVAWHGFIDAPGKIRLIPTPNADAKQVLIPYVVLTLPTGCSIDQDVVPAWMFRYWKDHWLDGVLGKLMMQPDKPYTNLLQAQYHGKRFRTGMAQAREMAKTQFTNAETSFTFPRWA
jgi:hypothetical protein